MLYVVLGCKVSKIFMVISLLAVVGKMIGSCFMGGEIINCLLVFLSFTYSSNVKIISFALKSVLKFFGLLYFKTGARVSFSPPVMLPLLAQLIIKNTSKNGIYLKLFFNITVLNLIAQNNDYICFKRNFLSIY
ncbi:hypothetical protein D3C87_1500140 [compost metagenome]